MCRSELHVLCAFASLRAALDQPWPQQLAQGNQELTRLRFGLVLVKDIGQPQTNVNKNDMAFAFIGGFRIRYRTKDQRRSQTDYDSGTKLFLTVSCLTCLVTGSKTRIENLRPRIGTL